MTVNPSPPRSGIRVAGAGVPGARAASMPAARVSCQVARFSYTGGAAAARAEANATTAVQRVRGGRECPGGIMARSVGAHGAVIKPNRRRAIPAGRPRQD